MGEDLIAGVIGTIVLASPLVAAWAVCAAGLARAPRSPDRAREARRALILASGPCAAGVNLALLLPAHPAAHPMLVGLPAAAAGTAVLVSVLGALAVRLRAPRDGEDVPLAADRLFVPWLLAALVTPATSSLVLGLWHRLWWEGALVGLALAPFVAVAQRIIYARLARDGPPSEPRIRRWTILAPLALVLAVAGWTPYATRPSSILRGELGASLPDSVRDVRRESSERRFLWEEWQLSFLVDPADLQALARDAGFQRDAGSSYRRTSTGGLVQRREDLWLDSATGRAWYVSTDGLE